MKGIKSILIILTMFMFNLSVSAASGCTYKEQTELNSDMSNIKIIYEIQDDKVDIFIYNITNNIYVTYNNPETEQETEITYYDTEDGKYIIERDSNNLEEYKFQIKSNKPSCYGNILTTKTIIKPKYNQFSNLEICNNQYLQNHSYCQKYITTEINKSEEEVEESLKQYLEARVKKITTTTTKVEKSIFDKKHITIYSGTGIILGIVIIVIILLIKKKRSEL